MSDGIKFTYLEDKLIDTADDFYPLPKSQETAKTSINSLVVVLNGKKSYLRSLQIEQASYNQKLNEIDVQVDKQTITNQYLSNDADALAQKQAEALMQKGQLLNQLKDWKEAVISLKQEVNKSEVECKERRMYVASLQGKQQEIREEIKSKQAENKEIYDYNLNLDVEIEKNDNDISKMKEHRDSLAKTATTLDTFTKSFKKNILAKTKELSRAKFQTKQLENTLVSKEFQRTNLQKQKEKNIWECKMYDHHNQEIQKTNIKLKNDLQKLVIHLESLKKNSKYLSSCIKDYSDTGVLAAKRILQQANK